MSEKQGVGCYREQLPSLCRALGSAVGGEQVGEERRRIERGWREGERESERKGLRVLIVLSPLVTRCLN